MSVSVHGFASMLLLSAWALLGCSDSSERVDPGPEPGESVEILRDKNGVAHIYAANDEDLFYGYGYQLAEDRLYQLDYFRRRAYGRGAEALGGEFPGVQSVTILGDDRLVRMFDTERWGNADWRMAQEHNPERYALIRAWVDGINQRIREVQAGEAPLPPEFTRLDLSPEPWEYVDPFVTMKMAHLVMDQTILYKILMTIVGDFAPDALNKVDILKPARPVYAAEDRSRAEKSASRAAPFGPRQRRVSPSRAEQLVELIARVFGNHMPYGSNNWAVSGEHTDTGRPLIAGDPHLGAIQSGYPYAVHLNSADAGGTFNAAGYAFVAGPGLLSGRNENLVWAPTSSFGDPMDFWSVKSLEGGKAVEIAGKRVEVVERREVFEVEDGETFVDVMRDVPGYGVLFDPDRAGVPLAASVLAGEQREVLIGYVDMRARPSRWFLETNRARNLDEFDDAVDRMEEMSFNMVAASAEGITYRVGQEVPTRNIDKGIQPWRILDGDDPDAWWTGLGGDPETGFEIEQLGPDRLPHSRGERGGLIVTANNDPFGFTADGNPGNDEWYYGAFFLPGWRAARVTSELERLSARGDMSVDDMKALQVDVHSNLFEHLQPVLLDAFDAFDAKNPDLVDFWDGSDAADLQVLVDLLRGWNGQARREETAPVPFFVLAHTMSRNALEDDIGVLYGQIIDRAPMYMFKIMTLLLTDGYDNGHLALQKNGTECVTADPSTCDLYTKNEFVMTCLRQTADWLRSVYGTVDSAGYVYGDWHRANMEGGYGAGGIVLPQIPADGDESTVSVASFTKFTDDREAGWTYDWMPIVRSVGTFDEAGRPQMDFTLPWGNVADEASPYFDNLRQNWTEGGYARMYFDRADVEAHADATRQITISRPTR